MKLAWHIFRWCILAVLLVFCHLGAAYLLPPPWNTMNILFVTLLLTMLLTEAGSVVWLAFFSHFIIELYATSPFGIILFSSTLSILIAFWLYQYFLTNKSWYTAFVITFVGIVLYRTFYTVLLGITTGIMFGISLPWRFLLISYFWELFLTTSATGLLYVLITVTTARKRRVLLKPW